MKKIRIMKDKGLSSKEIAALLDKTEEEVEDSLREDYRTYKMEQETTERIAELYKEGKTLKEISQITGYSCPSISKRLERSLGRVPRKYKQLTDNDRNEIYKLYQGGKTYTEIADIYKVDRTTIFRTVVKFKNILKDK
jgi:DNA-binding CsgD family transcriptional regulator